MDIKKYKMCVSKNNVSKFKRAVEDTKKSHHYHIRRSYLSIKEIDSRPPYLDSAWFEVEYSREYLVFYLGVLYGNSKS